MYGDKINVLNVLFDALDMDGALIRALGWLENPQARYVVTPNAEIAYASLRDTALREALNGADLVLPDGIGIVKGSQKLGRPLPERVPGVEFGPALFPAMERSGKKLYLLGGKPGVAEQAAARVRETYPALSVCGVHDGYFKDDGTVLADIAQCRPDVIFVCLGAPKQELWMSRNRDKVGPALMLGLGGTMDHLAGQAVRAPVLFRRLGLEWLYRIALHPSRWKRAMALPAFMIEVRRQKRAERRGGEAV